MEIILKVTSAIIHELKSLLFIVFSRLFLLCSDMLQASYTLKTVSKANSMELGTENVTVFHSLQFPLWPPCDQTS